MIPVRVERRGNVPSRWTDPFGELDVLTDFGRLVDRVFGGRDGAMWFPADIWEDAENVYIELEMPGLRTENVQLSYEDGILRVEGERKAPEHKGEYHLSERRYGKFVRTFQLPNVVNPDSINASFRDGVLLVTLAKRPETKARKIEIKTT